MSNPKVEMETRDIVENYKQLCKIIAYSKIVKNKSNQMLKMGKEPDLRVIVFQNNLITSIENNMKQLYIH